MLTGDQQRLLLQLARDAVIAAASHRNPPSPLITDEVLTTAYGAFVTLTKSGELRGCIGYPEARFPLWNAVLRAASAAAVHDPRFQAVTPDEVASLRVEISVLSPLQRIRPDDVVVGTHGLVVEKGGARGLLLPQVPVEWGWNRETFLAQVCGKAGLPYTAWQDPDAALYGFTAEVFAEDNVGPE